MSLWSLVLLPASGSVFVNVLGACLPNVAVGGLIACVVEPVDISSSTGMLTFGTTGGVQNITDVDLSTGGLVKPKFIAGGELATAETTEIGTFSKDTEVT